MSNDLRSDLSHDDEFVMTTHIQDGDYDIIDYEVDNHTIEQAQRWAAETNRVIVIPTKSLEELENTWIAFNQMIKKHRRESDWKCLELFNKTNQEMYEMAKDQLMHGDVEAHETIRNDLIGVSPSDAPVAEGAAYYTDNLDSYYGDILSYTSEELERAKQEAKDNNRVIIVPTRTLEELENLWDAYNMQIKKHRRESDWISQQYLGITNLRHYEYLKREFLKDDVSTNDMERYGSLVESATLSAKRRYICEAFEESKTETTKQILNMFLSNRSLYEEVLTSNIVSDVLDKYDSELIDPADIIDELAYGDLPLLSPEEIEEFGAYSESPEDNFYHTMPDNTMLTDRISVKEWFELYKEADHKDSMKAVSPAWVNKVRQLMFGLKRLEESGDEAAINARKQSILELGWDPGVEFTDKARILAREMAIERMKSTFSGALYRFIDLKECYNAVTLDGEDETLNEKTLPELLKPIFLVLVEGSSAMSAAIKLYTQSIYSHAAISLDSSLKKMYSFGIELNKVSNHVGFRQESIDDIKQGSRIGVFSFFVSPSVYKKFEEFIDTFKKNIEKTKYSFINIATFVFKIPINMKWELICSQFVDKCLKFAGIDATKKNSATVAPADLMRSLMKDNRVFSLYEAPANQYNQRKIDKVLNSLRYKVAPLKENYTQYYTDQDKYIVGICENINNIEALQEMENHIDVVGSASLKNFLEHVVFDSIKVAPIGEAKEFPVQFDKEGNLILRNINKLDFEAEYAKSHKLLQQYHEAKDFVGMKYELSKLWMMVNIIEDKLRSKKTALKLTADQVKAYNDAKAKIMNDFKFYLKEVMIDDPRFNFTEYYENSPFSSTTTKISSSTIVFLTKMIRKLTRFIG